MGFNFGDAALKVGGAAYGSMAAPTIGGAAALAGSGMLNSEVPSPGTPPDTDPRLKEIRDRQFALAGDFRQKAPGLMAASQTAATEQAGTDLGKENKDTNAGFNRRGLLYSGLEKNAEAQNAQKTATGLAATRQKIATGYQDQQRALDQQAFESGAKLQDLEQKRMDMVYHMNLERQQAQVASNTSPLGLLGGVLGLPGQAVGGLF